MKKLIAIIAVALPLAFSARAQWIVYDPTGNIQQISGSGREHGRIRFHD